MSVSTRSPITQAAPIPFALSKARIGGWGFPATSGSIPVVTRTAATIAPPPGSNPPATG